MSGRIRTIKPEWRFDEKLQGCSDEARVMSVCLITLSDDWGCGRASPGYLAGECWGQEMAREDGARAAAVLAKVSRALRELRGVDFVTTYEVGGQTYFNVTKWELHQRVDNRAKNRRIPAPPLANDETSRGSSESLARHSRGSPLDLDLGSGPRASDAREAAPQRRETLAEALGEPPKPPPSSAGALAAEKARELVGLAMTNRKAVPHRDCSQPMAPLWGTLASFAIKAAKMHGTTWDKILKATIRAWADDQAIVERGYPVSFLAANPNQYLGVAVKGGVL